MAVSQYSCCGFFFPLKVYVFHDFTLTPKLFVMSLNSWFGLPKLSFTESSVFEDWKNIFINMGIMLSRTKSIILDSVLFERKLPSIRYFIWLQIFSTTWVLEVDLEWVKAWVLRDDFCWAKETPDEGEDYLQVFMNSCEVVIGGI